MYELYLLFCGKFCYLYLVFFFIDIDGIFTEIFIEIFIIGIIMIFYGNFYFFLMWKLFYLMLN